MTTRFPILRDPDDEQDPAPAAFARALEAFEHHAPDRERGVRVRRITVGMKVRGTVVAIGPEHALLDIGARSEAVADLAHFRNEDGTLRIATGEPLELYVVEDNDQVVLAPSLRTDHGVALGQIRGAHAAGVPVTGRVTAINAGGLEVDLGGARGFCPVSQIESGYCTDPSTYLGRTLEFLVTGIEDTRRSVVLSRRQLLRRMEEEETRRRLATLKPGDELEGKVTRLEAFGAFVNLGGMDGLVHVSEIQYGRLTHPRDVLREGDQVRVRVLRIEAGKDGRPRIALSIKASSPDPWTEVPQRFTAGMRVKGVVARLAEFGAFVTLEPGIDGLVHVSEIAGHRVERVKDALVVGQEVEAIVLAVEVVKRRISLSIHAARTDDEPANKNAGASEPAAVAPAAPSADLPPTTMAIALREAAERARRKMDTKP